MVLGTNVVWMRGSRRRVRPYEEYTGRFGASPIPRNRGDGVSPSGTSTLVVRKEREREREEARSLTDGAPERIGGRKTMRGGRRRNLAGVSAAAWASSPPHGPAPPPRGQARVPRLAGHLEGGASMPRAPP
jgi:hypothetical protein